MTADKSTGLERLRVLVVDDNRHMRRLLAVILHGLRVGEVREAAGVTEALAEMRSLPPDIVFVDWVLQPPLDGIEFVRSVRTAKDSPNPYVPIIMLTGHTQTRRVREARDAGVTEFLAKPVSAKSVAARLAHVINNPRPFVRSNTYFGPDRRRHFGSYDGPERRAADAAQPLLTDNEISALLKNTDKGNDQ
jgi:CheY-like chemotaxis protein